MYADAKAAIDWLKDAFGFEASVVITGDDERAVPHSELRTPWGGGVMLSSRPPEDDPFATVAVGSGCTYIAVDDPDALHARCTAAGAEVVRPLEDTDFGSRTFTVRDPEGNIWSFGTYAGG